MVGVGNGWLHAQGQHLMEYLRNQGWEYLAFFYSCKYTPGVMGYVRSGQTGVSVDTFKSITKPYTVNGIFRVRCYDSAVECTVCLAFSGPTVARDSIFDLGGRCQSSFCQISMAYWSLCNSISKVVFRPARTRTMSSLVTPSVFTFTHFRFRTETSCSGSLTHSWTESSTWSNARSLWRRL